MFIIVLCFFILFRVSSRSYIFHTFIFSIALLFLAFIFCNFTSCLCCCIPIFRFLCSSPFTWLLCAVNEGNGLWSASLLLPFDFRSWGELGKSADRNSSRCLSLRRGARRTFNLLEDRQTKRPDYARARVYSSPARRHRQRLMAKYFALPLSVQWSVALLGKLERVFPHASICRNGKFIQTYPMWCKLSSVKFQVLCPRLLIAIIYNSTLFFFFCHYTLWNINDYRMYLVQRSKGSRFIWYI